MNIKIYTSINFKKCITMRKKICLVSMVILLLSGITTFGQTRIVTGTVYNADTNEPLEGIKISVKGDTTSTLSDNDGKYEIKVSEQINSISFSDFEGMTVKEIRIIGSDTYNLYLSFTQMDIFDLSLEELMNLTVTTAGKQAQKISDIPASVVVISRADIEAYGYQSLKEILSNALGLYKVDDYRNVSFGVRGFFSNIYNRNIVFMINGVKQQQILQNWNDLNQMNLQVESIERIEFVRGPTAIIYGNDAFFGAINIITHQNGKQIQSSFTAAYGSDNTYRSNFQVNSATENTTINVSAGVMHTDGRDIKWNKIIDSVQRYDLTWVKDGTTKDFFRQNSNYLNLNITHKGFYANMSYDETLRNLTVAPLLYDTVKDNRRDIMYRTTVGYNGSIGEKFSYDVHVGLDNLLWKNILEKWNIMPGSKFGYTISEAKQISVEAITFTKPIDKLNITFGANYSNKPFSYQQSDAPDKKIYRSTEMLLTPNVVYGAFGQIEYALTKKIQLLAGIRAEKQEPYDFKNVNFIGANNDIYHDTIYSYHYDKANIIPRFAVVIAFNERNILKLMYSQAISRPGTYENSFILWSEHPLLIPQTIATTEINYSSLINDVLNYNISIFYNSLNNLINRRNYYTADGLPINENNNTGSMETYGGEFQILYKPIERLTLDASFSYQKTRNMLFDIDASNSPNVLAYFKAIYHIKKNIILGLNSYYVGEILADWDEAPKDPLNGDFSAKGRIYKPTPAYFNLSANLRFNNILNKGFYCSIHAENILNSDIFYAPTLTSRSNIPNGSVDAGIKLNATLGIKF